MNAKMKEACESVADIFEALPECWTKDNNAVNRYGFPVTPCHQSARQWCAVGGVMAAMSRGKNQWRGIHDALQPFAAKLGYDTPEDANDTGHRKVAIRMLRLAAQS